MLTIIRGLFKLGFLVVFLVEINRSVASNCVGKRVAAGHNTLE